MSALVLNDEKLASVVPSIDTFVARPPIEDYFRIDEEVLSNNPHFVDGNAFHDTLRGNREVLVYEVYQKREGNELACVIQIGDKLNGHPGIVHGGIISTAFDNSYGWLFFTMGIPPAFTVNLNVNFRRPVLQNSTAILRAKVVEIKGRKIFMSGTWENSEGDILADSTALFVTPKQEAAAVVE